jgi:SAM-dependent methyltransferase
MNPRLKALFVKVPGLRALRDWQRNRRVWRTFPGSAGYWQQRYSEGGNSGSGSYGALAEFKASVLNRFVREQYVSSVIEFGCGDGNQLGLAAYPTYIGFDVARTAIQFCRAKFSDDRTKSFFLYDPECFIDNAQCFRADATISLDVIFHLVEDRIFEQYMEHLFQCANRFVIIYSSNEDNVTKGPQERHRHFTDYVEVHFPGWRFLEKIENRYPMSKYPPHLGSLADFYIYERIAT